MRSTILSLPLVLALGCSHPRAVSEAPPAAPAPAPVAVASPPVVAPPAAPPVQSCTADAQCRSSQLCLDDRCVAITPALEACGVNRVHFDLDRADLHPDELALLDRAARCLRADRQIHVVVEGNADERGSAEYNVRLGERRATAVAEYLARAGVQPAQVVTVSYGKEIPLCAAHDEACWRLNRRASVVPNGAPKQISHLLWLDEQSERAAARKARSVTGARHQAPEAAKARTASATSR